MSSNFTETSNRKIVNAKRCHRRYDAIKNTHFTRHVENLCHTRNDRNKFLRIDLKLDERNDERFSLFQEAKVHDRNEHLRKNLMRIR